MNKHMKAVIEKYRQGGFEPKPKETSQEKAQIDSGQKTIYKETISPVTNVRGDETYKAVGAKTIKLELNPYTNYESIAVDRESIYQGNFNFQKSSSKGLWNTLE